MLDVFISSRVRRKIVIVFAKYPDFKVHARGLSKIVKENSGNIQRELSRLRKSGFLTTQKVGNTLEYQTNKNFPLLRELQSMVIKTQQHQARLKSERAAAAAVRRTAGRAAGTGSATVDNQIISMPDEKA